MTNITPEQIAAWRELAEKATPRPWVKDSKFVSYPVKDSFGRQLWMPANEHYSDGDPDTDAEFIVAAVNNFIPALDEIERLTAESQEWKNLSNTFKFFANLADTNSDQLAKDNDRLASENAALKARAEAAERELAEYHSRQCEDCEWFFRDPKSDYFGSCLNRETYFTQIVSGMRCALWTPRESGHD